MIKRGKGTLYYFLAVCLFYVLIISGQSQSYIALAPLTFLLSIAVLLYIIMYFRWKASFAIFLDVDKQEIILNHSLSFRKKRISLKDIKEVDTLNGTIILFASTSLSKWQKIICKTKMSNDYTVRFEIIETSEKRELIRLLSTWISRNKK
jgi:hypothetical protein